jgi:hypothetical protein
VPVFVLCERLLSGKGLSADVAGVGTESRVGLHVSLVLSLGEELCPALLALVFPGPLVALTVNTKLTALAE